MACARLYGPVLVVLIGAILRPSLDGLAAALIVIGLLLTLPVHIGENQRRMRDQGREGTRER